MSEIRSVADYVWVFREVVPTKGTKSLLKNGAVHFKH